MASTLLWCVLEDDMMLSYCILLLFMVFSMVIMMFNMLLDAIF